MAKVISKLAILMLLAACSSSKTQSELNYSVSEFNKLANLKFSPATVRWILDKRSASSDELKPFSIYAVIKIKSQDLKFTDSIISRVKVLKEPIYINETKMNYPIFSSIKKKVKKEGDFYRLNQAAFSISEITKDPFFTGYFVMLKKDLMFVSLGSGR